MTPVKNFDPNTPEGRTNLRNILGPGWRLAERGVMGAAGFTAPQEIMGSLGLLKEIFSKMSPKNANTPLNLRLGPGGEIMYDSPSMPDSAAAMGSFIRTSPSASNDPDILKHEMRHVAQSDALGPAFLPLGIAEMLSNYSSRPLERDAIEHATPQSEFLRPGSSMNKGEAHPLIQALVKRFTER